jgi:hypothetical protein
LSPSAKSGILPLACALIFIATSRVLGQCDCARDLWPDRSDLIDTPYRAFLDADLVFYGQVVAVRKLSKTPSRPTDQDYEAEAFFAVEKVWKKSAAGILRLRQSVDGCIRDFDIGHRWLIYGYYDNAGLLRTGYCSRSRRADQNPELDIEEFQKRGLKEGRVKKPTERVTITLD